jgi:hypothetical protein
MNVKSGQTYYVLTSGARAGAVGSLTLGLEWPDDSVAVATSTAGIVESAPGSYTATRVAPTVTAVTEYVIVWYDPITDTSVTEALTVSPLSTPGIDAGARALRRRARYKQRAVTDVEREISYTYGTDGDRVPTGDVTLLAVNAAGEAIYSGPAEQADGEDRYTATLPPESLSTIDILALVWTADVAGATRVDVTVLDVCSARLFTIAQMRSFREMTEEDYSDSVIEDARLAAEDFLEDACGLAFAVRYHECDLNGVEWYTVPGLQMPHHDVQALRALIVSGEAVTAEDLTAYFVGAEGYVYAPADIIEENISVAYEHGAVTPDATRAALILARRYLIDAPLDSRATALPVEGGGMIHLLTPGVRGSLTGIPEVDVFIQSHAA